MRACRRRLSLILRLCSADACNLALSCLPASSSRSDRLTELLSTVQEKQAKAICDANTSAALVQASHRVQEVQRERDEKQDACQALGQQCQHLEASLDDMRDKLAGYESLRREFRQLQVGLRLCPSLD